MSPTITDVWVLGRCKAFDVVTIHKMPYLNRWKTCMGKSLVSPYTIHIVVSPCSTMYDCSISRILRLLYIEHEILYKLVF